MATFALTPAQRKVGKWILRRAIDIAEGGAAYLLSGLDEDTVFEGPVNWTRWHIRWLRNTPAGIPEDKGEFKLDLLNITAGEPDLTWTTADLTAVHNALFALRTALLPRVHSSQQFSENVAYLMRYNPAMDPKHPFALTGPPVWSAASTQAGTGAGIQAYQVAGTITLKTPFAKHWGRCYLPTPPNGDLDSNGRLTSGYRSGVANAFRTCFTTLQDAGFWPVIPMTQANKTPAHSLMGVQELQVDDIPDVQRRRRVKSAGARTLA